MANTYTRKEQLSNGVWVVPDGDKSWGGELNYNFYLLNGLLDRHTLTVKQNNNTLGTFDGTENVSVNVNIEYATADDIDALFPAQNQGNQGNGEGD